MRKFFISTLALLGLSLGATFAQSTQWAGVSTGFPLGLIAHYGIKDLIADNIDLRANLAAVTFLTGPFSITGGVDALYNLDVEMDLPLNVYVGGGLGIGLSIQSDDPDTTTVTEGIGLDVNVRGLAGGEYPITEQLGVYGELQVGLGLAQLFRPGLVIGINYHF